MPFLGSPDVGAVSSNACEAGCYTADVGVGKSDDDSGNLHDD